jgi:polyisoprenoid-binding protein YceI
VVTVAVGLLALSACLFGRGAAFAGEGPRTFVLDAAESRLSVRLFRKGLFSGFGHEHVIVARGLAGRVVLDPQNARAAKAEVAVAVSVLEVDAPAERKRAGLEGELEEDDRASVRKTMLGPDQLDVQRFPHIRAETEGVEGALPRLTLRTSIRIKGTQRTVQVPATVLVNGETLTAEGEFELLQSAFGIEPFSVLLGAVAVEDRVRIAFRLVGRVSR